MDIKIGEEEVGRLTIDLWDNCPKTVENFVGQCKGAGPYTRNDKECQLHYKGCVFYRILSNKFAASGDTCYQSGVGGCSIFWDKEK